MIKEPQSPAITPSSNQTEEKFINYVMKNGKKTVAREIFRDTLKFIGEKKKGMNAMEIFKTAIENAKPAMEVRPKRVGGAMFQVPREVPVSRQQMLAFRWILDAARSKKGVSMYKKLADELIQASENTGNAIKKKEDTHKMAQANKAFAHLAKY